MRLYLIIFFLIAQFSVCAQGEIDHIKNQHYMELDIDCDCDDDSCVSSIRNRYCANLAFQKTDSLLTLSYDSLLVLMGEFSNLERKTDSISVHFEMLQKEWRKYRNSHCLVFWSDSDCNSNYCATQYLSCMKYITELRVEDLNRLVTYYNKQIHSYLESGIPVRTSSFIEIELAPEHKEKADWGFTVEVFDSKKNPLVKKTAFGNSIQVKVPDSVRKDISVSISRIGYFTVELDSLEFVYGDYLSVRDLRLIRSTRNKLPKNATCGTHMPRKRDMPDKLGLTINDIKEYLYLDEQYWSYRRKSAHNNRR